MREGERRNNYNGCPAQARLTEWIRNFVEYEKKKKRRRREGKSFGKFFFAFVRSFERSRRMGLFRNDLYAKTSDSDTWIGGSWEKKWEKNINNQDRVLPQKLRARLFVVDILAKNAKNVGSFLFGSSVCVVCDDNPSSNSLDISIILRKNYTTYTYTIIIAKETGLVQLKSVGSILMKLVWFNLLVL